MILYLSIIGFFLFFEDADRIIILHYIT